MRLILQARSFYVLGTIVLLLVVLGFLFTAVRSSTPPPVTTTVERGDVQQIVSVSGIVEASQTAELSFANSGRVTSVLVTEGDTVEAGALLATQAATALAADYTEALAALKAAQASRDELVDGPRAEAKEVTAQTVASAETNLEKVTAEEDEKIATAYRALLAIPLTAETSDPFETASAPLVSGTYQCTTTGEYRIEVYRSSGQNIYSYRLRGLEVGTYPVSYENPSPFGECGLSLQFTEGDNYSGSVWTISIPNPNTASYQAAKNAYELALVNREHAITTAEQALTLAREEANLANAAPRIEERVRADAAVQQAEAKIARINVEIADRSIIAPFSGTITDVSVVPGEIAGTASVLSMLATDSFELTARIPEIDIAKIQEGDSVEALFDANTNQTLEGFVSYLSPVATTIDGVAYFEATITLTNPTAWLRAGLNADIDIIVDHAKDTLRIPKRFIIDDKDGPTVLVKTETTVEPTRITKGLMGNDGYVAISGLREGMTLIAP